MNYTMKKITAFMLTLMMLVNIAPLNVLATDIVEAPPLRYNEPNDFDVEINFLDYDNHIVEARVGKDLASTSYSWKTLMQSTI